MFLKAIAFAGAALAVVLLPAEVQPAWAQEASTPTETQEAALTGAPARPGLYVADHAWTSGVGDDRQVAQTFDTSAPVGPIFLWTRMVGSQSALEQLREENRLPIWHQWFVSCGAEVEFDRAARPIDEVDLRIDGADAIDGLQREVNTRDFFDWKTWSMKQNVSACRYTVRVVDNRADPVWCEDLGANCEFSITLGR